MRGWGDEHLSKIVWNHIRTAPKQFIEKILMNNLDYLSLFSWIRPWLTAWAPYVICMRKKSIHHFSSFNTYNVFVVSNYLKHKLQIVNVSIAVIARVLTLCGTFFKYMIAIIIYLSFTIWSWELSIKKGNSFSFCLYFV